MAGIWVPNRRVWTAQPSQPAEIDWANPLAAGLVTAIDFGNGPLGGVNLIGKTPSWTTSPAFFGANINGRGTSVATNGYLKAPDGTVSWDRVADIAYGFTSLVVVTFLAKTSASNFIAGDVSPGSASYNWGHYFGTGTNSYSFYVKNGASTVANTAEANVFVANRLYALAGCYDYAEGKVKVAVNGTAN